MTRQRGRFDRGRNASPQAPMPTTDGVTDLGTGRSMVRHGERMSESADQLEAGWGERLVQKGRDTIAEGTRKVRRGG